MISRINPPLTARNQGRHSISSWEVVETFLHDICQNCPYKCTPNEQNTYMSLLDVGIAQLLTEIMDHSEAVPDMRDFSSDGTPFTGTKVGC